MFILCNFTKSQLLFILLTFVIPQLVCSHFQLIFEARTDKMIHFSRACCCSSVCRFTASPIPSAGCFILFVLSLKGFGEKIQSRQDAQTLLVWGGCFEYFIVWFVLQKIPRKRIDYLSLVLPFQRNYTFRFKYNICSYQFNSRVVQITANLLMSSMK